MSKFMDKFLSFVGLEDRDDDLDMFEQEPEEDEEIIKPSYFSAKRSKVVSIATTAQLQVVVLKLESFEDSKDVADYLKAKKPVVVNFEDVEKDVARRVIDFLSGTVYALGGNIQKVSNGIFLVAPYNVGIMGDFKKEFSNTDLFSLD